MSFEAVFGFNVNNHGNRLRPLFLRWIVAFGVTRGCLLIRGVPRFHRLLEPVHQIWTLFLPLLMTVTFDQTSIKHSLYTWKVHYDRIPTKKEPCLTPTLMDEGQSRNPNTTYKGYIMEFWKFVLTWKLICPVQHKIPQKEQKETTKEHCKRDLP